MRIAALSDFHIGSSERGDCFRHSLEEFHAFLDELEASHDQIVLLGDIFQAEYGRVLGRAAKSRELSRAQRRVPSLWTRMQGPMYRYVHGNHDEVAGAIPGVFERLELESDGFRVYFIHGHQFDPLLTRLYPVAQLSTWVSGRVRSLGLGALSDWLEHKDIALKHEAFKGSAGPYAQAAAGLLREQNADLVVMGHTHVPQRVELSEGLFVNTGTCSLGQRMHVSIDTESRQVQLHT